MKVFSFLALVFIVSCSSDQKNHLPKDTVEQELSYHEQIFIDPNPVFNGFELGDSLLEDIVLTKYLSNSDSFTSKIKSDDIKINAIELEVHIERKADAKVFIAGIVAKYNKLFNYNKAISNFVTWTYTTQKNLPVEIILIYEENLNSISLNIGYKSQR